MYESNIIPKAETIEQFIELCKTANLDVQSKCEMVGNVAYQAAMKAIFSLEGGLTPAQKQVALFTFIRLFGGIQSPIKLVDFADMLDPRNEYQFKREISRSTWRYLIEQASFMLNNSVMNSQHQRDHLKSIVNGTVPFGYRVEANIQFDVWYHKNPDATMVEGYKVYKEMHPELPEKAMKKAFADRIVALGLKGVK